MKTAVEYDPVTLTPKNMTRWQKFGWVYEGVACHGYRWYTCAFVAAYNAIMWRKDK